MTSMIAQALRRLRPTENAMMTLDIPGFGPLRLSHLVSDFTGTLSVDGQLLPGVGERLRAIAEHLHIHILTADTFGTALTAMDGLPVEIILLNGANHDVQKEAYVQQLETGTVVAFGNGNNDRRMLKTARVGLAVSQGEGCAVAALMAADVHVTSAVVGLDLLLHPQRLKATLRF